MVNPAGSIVFILKPPQNFESLYEGVSRTTPIPFVAKNENGDFLGLDALAGKAEVAGNLARFVPVPIASSLLIAIPVPRYQDGSSTRSPAYLYDFRWRLRTVSDYNAREKDGNPDMPFSMIPTLGAPSTPNPPTRRVMPVYTSEQVTPALVGNPNRQLVAPGTIGSLSQGVYNPADFAGATAPTDGDLSLGITFFPPYLRPSVGNELSICVSAADGTWSFSDTSATGDAALSNLYGTNVAGPAHPVYPGVGIVLVSLTRNTTP